MPSDIKAIINYLDKYLTNNNLTALTAIEANFVLENAGLLNDYPLRRGRPLRILLRNGDLPHAYQVGQKGSAWMIPLSTSKERVSGASKKDFKKAKSLSLEEYKRVLEGLNEKQIDILKVFIMVFLAMAML